MSTSAVPRPGPTSSLARCSRPASPPTTSISRPLPGDHMRRITLWVLSTLSALVLLFAYSTSTSGPQATRAPSSVYSSSTSGPSTAESTGGTGASEPSADPTPSGSSASGAKSVTGSVAQTQWGPVQVQLKVSNGKITDVSVIQYPN